MSPSSLVWFYICKREGWGTGGCLASEGKKSGRVQTDIKIPVCVWAMFWKKAPITHALVVLGQPAPNCAWPKPSTKIALSAQLAMKICFGKIVLLPASQFPWKLMVSDLKWSMLCSWHASCWYGTWWALERDGICHMLQLSGHYDLQQTIGV